jgi:CHRD domain
MQKRTLIGVAAIALLAGAALPTIAFGNARNNVGNQHFFQTAQTPFVARLLGGNETPTGDPDAAGMAAVTFDIVTPSAPANGAEVCWDLSYSGLTGTPTAARIQSGVAGVNGVIIIPFGGLGLTSATGCSAAAPAVVQQIIDNPSAFYVNVTTSDFGGGAIRAQLAKGDPPGGEAHMLPAPLRAYDSRLNSGPKIAAGETRTISLATGVNGQSATVLAVPPGATAAIVTLTVTETVAGGFLTMYSAATTQPATSSINWFASNQTFAVSTQVAVDAAGQVKVTSGPSSAQFIIDVVGYLF